MSDNRAESRTTLGIVSISRNEEADMPRFLEHLLPWVDEIVIVDDRSSDGTAAIVDSARPKVKLVVQPMDGELGFSGQRNRGIEAATSDWLLHMDIDERVPPDLAAEILDAIPDPTKNAYQYRRLNFSLHRPMRGSGWQRWNRPQLARRGKHRFRNRVHEECVVDGTPESIGQLEARMWHLNDEDYVERLRKSFVYCQYEADGLLERGYRVKWYDFLLRPLLSFGSKYVLHQAHRDGVLGLLLTTHSACATFRAYALAWDRQNRISRQDLEDELSERWQASHGQGR